MNPTNREAVAIAVFSRAPVPGQAKTRLIPSLGAEGAARLQREFLRRTLQTAASAQFGPVSLWCTPGCGHPAFQQCRVDFDLILHPQCSGDLGARMFDAFNRLCATGPVLLIGTDCPALTPAHLRMAASTLQEGDAAVFSCPPRMAAMCWSGLGRPNPACLPTCLGAVPKPWPKPAAALCYVWDNRHLVGVSAWNAYTDRVRMIVVESGPQHAGTWRSEQRGVAADFRAAFGEEAPPVIGIALAADTDNTGESVTA
jgi:hypothetical protein